MSQELFETNSNLTRRDIRSLIFHLVYAMEGFDYSISLEALVDTFNRGYELQIPTDGEIFTTAQAVIDQRKELDHHGKFISIIQPEQ